MSDKNYYLLEPDDMVIALENKDAVIKEREELLKECENKIEEVMQILSKSPSRERNVTAHSILRKFAYDIENSLGEMK